LEVQDPEILEALFRKYKSERMERYIPIPILAETALIFGYSSNPPVEFLLGVENCLRKHQNLIREKVWTALQETFADNGKLLIKTVNLF
jgi:hypothetical protein